MALEVVAPGMPKRIQQVNQLIQKELSRILVRESDFLESTLVTITRVETSADLRQAKIYISVVPETQISLVMSVLNRLIYDFQQKLNRRLKMRPVPRIKFVKERQTQSAARVEQLIREIHQSSHTK